MSKLTFQMPDMDLLALDADDIVQTSEVLPEYTNPSIGPWVPTPGNK